MKMKNYKIEIEKQKNKKTKNTLIQNNCAAVVFPNKEEHCLNQ